MLGIDRYVALPSTDYNGHSRQEKILPFDIDTQNVILGGV